MVSEHQIKRDGDVFIAQHRSDPKLDARVDAEWTEAKDNDIHAPWEDLIAAIVSDDITEHIDIDSHYQLGSVDAETAVQNLASEIDEVESTQHAQALLECLQEEQVIEEDDDGEIVLFENVDGSASNSKYLYNWAAAMDMARTKIDQQIKRAEDLEEQLQRDLKEIDGLGEDFVDEDPQEQLGKVKQKMRALGGAEDSVPDPATLSPSEQNEYTQYKRTFQIARQRQRIKEQFTIDQSSERTPEPMEGQIQNFQELKQAFIEYEKHIRTTIRTNRWQKNNVGEMLDGLIDMMSGIAMLDQSLEEMDHNDIDEQLEELTSPVQETYEVGSEITEGEEDEEVEQAVDSKVENADPEGFDEHYQN
jgi:hypothetical protein